MKQLDHKVIVLTGGTEGIVYGCAKTYVKEGARLVLLAIGEDRIKTVLVELGPKHMGIGCDICHDKEVKQAFENILARFGRIDAIHNNAGIASPSKTLDETTEEEWNDLMDVNLKSIFYTVKYGINAVKASEGCILNTSSIVGEIGQELHAAYTATKGGINALAKSMALDYAKYNVRVNAVSPAGVWTPILKKWTEEQLSPTCINQYLNTIHPLVYCPQGDVIADACVLLLSKSTFYYRLYFAGEWRCRTWLQGGVAVTNQLENETI